MATLIDFSKRPGAEFERRGVAYRFSADRKPVLQFRSRSGMWWDYRAALSIEMALAEDYTEVIQEAPADHYAVVVRKGEWARAFMAATKSEAEAIADCYIRQGGGLSVSQPIPVSEV
jgi:hypothetical protein